MAKPKQETPPPTTTRGILALAAKGDESVRNSVVTLFDHSEKQSNWLVDMYGNMFDHACNQFVIFAAGVDLAAREGCLRKIKQVAAEQAGPHPTPLERILCERIALCWFDMYEMDRRYTDLSGMNFREAEFREYRRDRAHRRFLAACKTLAMVRKLTAPLVKDVSFRASRSTRLEASNGQAHTNGQAHANGRGHANHETNHDLSTHEAEGAEVINRLLEHRAFSSPRA